VPLVEDISLPSGADRPARKRKRRRKPYKYRSVQLGRPPTPLEERLLSLTEIPPRLDALTARLSETLVFLRADQLSLATSAATLRDQTAAVREVVWTVAHEAAHYGAEEHHREWRRQGLLSDPAPDVIAQRLELDLAFRRRLHARADWMMALWYDHVAATEQRIRQALTSSAVEAWRALVERDIKIHVKTLAASVVNSGFALGRTMERQRLVSLKAAAPDTLVFTAVLDANTCEECEDADGTEFEEDSDEEEEYAVPYFRCLSTASGENRCRCQVVAVGSEPGWVNAVREHLDILSLRDEALAHARQWATRRRNAKLRAKAKARGEPPPPRPPRRVRRAAPQVRRRAAPVADQPVEPPVEKDEAPREHGRIAKVLDGSAVNAIKYELGTESVTKKEIAQVFVEALPRGDYTMNISTGVRRVTFSAYDSDHTTELTRTFHRESNGDITVHHDYFVMPEEKQGKGTGRQLLRGSVALYEHMGVKRIDTLANINVGGYAWARYGFVADHPEQFADAIVERMGQADRIAAYRADEFKDKKWTPTYTRIIQKIVQKHRDDPRLVWHIADASHRGVKIGKWLMLNMDWHAHLDLTNQEHVARLKRYIGAK